MFLPWLLSWFSRVLSPAGPRHWRWLWNVVYEPAQWSRLPDRKEPPVPGTSSTPVVPPPDCPGNISPRRPPHHRCCQDLSYSVSPLWLLLLCSDLLLSHSSLGSTISEQRFSWLLSTYKYLMFYNWKYLFVYLVGSLPNRPQFVPARLVDEVRAVRLPWDGLELVVGRGSASLGLGQLLQGTYRVVLTRHPGGHSQLSVQSTNSWLSLSLQPGPHGELLLPTQPGTSEITLDTELFIKGWTEVIVILPLCHG